MSEILISYDEKKETFDSYALALKSLLNTLIRGEGLSVHSLDSRVKNRKSLEAKIEKKDKYNVLNDITDVIGIRIITHYADDVDRIARLVESEFRIDFENSIDKRISIEPDKFGYLSLHYIVNLNEARSNLKEYETYKDIKAEIQIRSILQHAWAEIEHDIGYKSAIGLPNNIRRAFSRLAGLLELADEEFIKIKEKISARQQEVAKELEQGAGESYLDIVALDEFLNKSSVLDDISIQIKEKHDLTVNGRNKDKDLEHLLNGLYFINITTITELNEALLKFKEHVINRASWFSDGFRSFYKNRPLAREAILAYLCQIIVALRNSTEFETEYCERAHVGLTGANIPPFFENLRKNLQDVES
ncbi:hypothetical protein SNQ23_003926 [Cronobacter dublinensis]|nr:hypothetical protein [Cronobacter dublinensis]